MLSCEDFGRSHQSALKSIVCGLEKSKDRNHGLSRSDITLNETVHHKTALKIPLHLGKRALLG